MVSAKRLAQMAKKWQKVASAGRKRLTWMTAKEADECCTSVPVEDHRVMYIAKGRRFEVPLAYLGTTIVNSLGCLRRSLASQVMEGSHCLVMQRLWSIQIANDPVKHELTKHIGVDASFTRSHCQQSTIHLQYVSSELQVADLFTKAQTREQHRLHVLKLNVLDPP